jgi:hypothetical protein
MRLTAHPVSGDPPRVRPASTRRQWMDDTPGKFAYFCLPLTLANTHGWEILCDGNHTIYWDGNDGISATQITSTGGRLVNPTSHFGSGIVTFHTGLLFRTDEAVNLWVTGPINSPKDGIAPLTGLVETDWAPFTFTMNWKMTRVGSVEFRDGEPICHIFPVMRGLIEDVEPTFTTPDQNDAERFETWRKSREDHNSSGCPHRQKVYAKEVNQTRCNPKPFEDRRGA